MPDLEVQQRPEQLLVILPPVEMLVDQRVELGTREPHAEEVGGHVLQLVRLVEDHRVVRRQRPGAAEAAPLGGHLHGEIGEEGDPKSISHEHTFDQDTADLEVLESTLARLSEMVGRRARRYGVAGKTVHLTIRYADFTTFGRQQTRSTHTNSSDEIYLEAKPAAGG